MVRTTVILLVILIAAAAAGGDEYVLKINGAEFEIGLDAGRELVLDDGTRLNVELSMKDELVCERPYFSFTHGSEYRPVTKKLGEGVHQTLMATAGGTLVMVQEYEDEDPTYMVGAIVEALTQEEIELGYDYEESGFSRKVGGRLIEGRMTVTENPSDRNVHEVCAVAGDHCGLLIITIIDRKSSDADQGFIEAFWHTLEIDLP
jgi:hypothetical protein